MSTEIPIWVNGKIRWLSGIDKKTTCKDVVEVLLEGEGIDKSEVKDFVIMERWRKVERPLDESSKILKIWSHWGNEKKEVRLCLRHVDNEVDSGRGSPVGNGNTPSLRRKRNRARGHGKPPWAHQETLHPRRLAELGRFSKKEHDDYYPTKTKESEGNEFSDRMKDIYVYDNKFNLNEIYNKTYDTESVNNRKKSGHKSYHCSGTGRLHSTPLSNTENHSKRTKCCSKKESKQKIRNSENIEKLMKLILAQGATIQSQLQKLKEREEQIESLEHERHRERIEKNGRNYLLETYLGSLKDAEIPVEIEDKKEDLIEAVNDQINSEDKDGTERLKQNETEQSLNKSTKIYGRSQGRSSHRAEDTKTQSLVQQSKLHQKSTRSKSESRSQDNKSDGSLKRTLSDNAIADSCNSAIVVSDNHEEEENDIESDKNAKEESEEVIELQRIQSQIEMWEKVFKINKKLEKEEENLVRLHIKIKKFHSENYRLAKEKQEVTEEPITSTESSGSPEKLESTSEEHVDEKDSLQIQTNLETLRSNLEQNSKEIYDNFTKLIEDDEIVEQKRTCLTKLISDLERTDHETEMLTEMIAMREKQIHDQVTSFSEYPYDSECDYNIQGFPQTPLTGKPTNNHLEIPNNNNMCSTIVNLPCKNQDYNQRTETEMEQEKLQPMKPKIVKISFEDQIQNCENLNGDHERLPKDPVPVATGALKSILKNKRKSYNNELDKSNLNNESQSYHKFSQEYGSGQINLIQQKNFNNGYAQIPYNCSPDIPEQTNLGYSYPTQYSIQNHYSFLPNQNPYGHPPQTKYSDDIKTAYPLRNLHPSGIPKPPTNGFPSAMVTTKAMVHNDTDSSTSSDTSGLSSMYSSSPTVEEHYVEQSYVLDTLV